MVGGMSQQEAVLAFLSLTIVGFICAICLRCKKNSMIVQENNQLYQEHVFQRAGSRFAVTRSKTVTRTNEMRSRNFANTTNPQLQTQTDLQTSYQNIPKSTLEPMYIDPRSSPPYSNTVLDNGEYENVFPTEVINHDSDSYDYENTEFLQKQADEDEPDYVNAENEIK
ncbi:LAT2 domain-containing protein [Trichomycterus rosablanca]|uniref:LAT2 domain-containing protein n=1 Tax=Trichomycterus rosablanca TaxID=2290929 RepID=UPI002F3540DA